jgi:hypothetical protein
MLSRRTLQGIGSVVLCLWLAVAQAVAGQMTLLGVGSSGGALPGPPTLTYVSNASPTASQSGAVETFTNATIGTASGFTTRRIIFALSSNNLSGPSAISSFTINGSAPVNGNIHVQQSQAGSGTPFAAIFSADIATGTTATIAVTYNSSVFNTHSLAIYSVDDALLVSTTPTFGSQQTAGATTLATSSFTQNTGGFTVSTIGFGAGVTSPSISGYTTDQTTGPPNTLSAHLSSIASTGSVTATANWTTSTSAAIVAASWR